MGQHTPGPWIIRKGHIMDARTHIMSLTPEIMTVCDVAGPNRADKLATKKANARLIAASPDLLEALRELLTKAEQLLDQRATHEGLANCTVLSHARTAIAKAEGGTI
jgi:hypothetical protein